MRLSSKKRFLNVMTRLLPQQVYKVVVNSDGKSWFIFRRYNEFHALHEKTYLEYQAGVWESLDTYGHVVYSEHEGTD
ncbi:hypothetical protein BaRGS_00020304 [Batillaria attramentaria]|uniref:PX domain-containing protein n=1 Tax=Batillaria attramentaria TaxID=370345 RepID=A0ABD0KMR7_9CAEN